MSTRKAFYAALAAPFPAESIHWRAQQVSPARNGGHGALALAYLDSRDVQDRLDAVVGPDNWQSQHFDCGAGKMGCRIGIRIVREDGAADWVWKSDGAGDTRVEAEKGAFSDAFKRAAVHWGIGRYLYDLGNTWVPCEVRENRGKTQFARFIEDPWNHVRNRAAFLPRQVDEA